MEPAGCAHRVEEVAAWKCEHLEDLSLVCSLRGQACGRAWSGWDSFLLIVLILSPEADSAVDTRPVAVVFVQQLPAERHERGEWEPWAKHIVLEARLQELVVTFNLFL